jgi:hypothetical protein
MFISVDCLAKQVLVILVRGRMGNSPDFRLKGLFVYSSDVFSLQSALK